MKIRVKVGQTRGGPSKFTTDHIEFEEEVEIAPLDDSKIARLDLAHRLEHDCEEWHRANQAKYKKTITAKADTRPDMFAPPRIKDVVETTGHSSGNINQGSHQGKVDFKF